MEQRGRERELFKTQARAHTHTHNTVLTVMNKQDINNKFKFNKYKKKITVCFLNQLFN